MYTLTYRQCVIMALKG